MKQTKSLSESEKLAQAFLKLAQEFQSDIELIKVLKSRTYRIGNANVLVRAASEANRRYFFGINYLTIEEISNLENPFIAFICGSITKTLIVPAKVLFNHLHLISHDRNGEYKINIDKDLNIVLAGRNNRLDCKLFINNWDNLSSVQNIEKEVKTTVEESIHSVIQGRLIEIGNIRGYQTYSPDKSRIFNEKRFEEITTLKVCPELQFSDYNLLRQIDVMWFKPRGNNFLPEFAFEVEISTGVWSGVGRMATLIDYSNVNLFVIANDSKKYKQVVSSFPEIRSRYKFVQNEMLGELYSAEINLKQLRIDIGL